MPLVSTSTMADELENASEALLSFKNGLSKKIKEEPMDEEFNPASLGLHRIGDALPSKPLSEKPLLNRRGMPARIRKKNKLFFDDEASPDTTVVPKSMLKTPRIKSPVKKIKKPKVSAETTPIKQEGGDRKLGQKIGMRLRNLLKLPKAHKWVCYEWFYSNIDSALFSGDNDFMVCLKESFPQLKTTMLTRVEWCKMRRMMGKPRRCSQAFFEEERKELDRKRSKIRQLQQRKPTDLNSCKDLPPEIPLQLVIGTKVTARLRTPQDGLFTGSVDAFDTSNDTYRITFERPGLGTHSIPDYEVLSNEPIETISVTSMVHALRPSLKPQTVESSISSSEAKTEALNEKNGFPINILEDIVKLGKLLEIKKIKVNVLKDMNLEAERKKCHSQYISEDFIKKYALNVVELEHINCTLDDLLKVVQNNCQERVPEMNIGSIMTPTYLRTQSLEEAKEIANQLNSTVKDPVLDLVVELTALMIQVKSLSESDRSSFEAEVLSTSMEVIKNKLTPANKCLFESNIEVHMRHIQSGLSGEMGAFSMVSRP